MGNYVFTGSGPTLLWLDLSDKRHPVVAWDTLMQGELSWFTIEDSIGYALVNWYSVIVVDFRNPSAPFVAGKVGIPGGQVISLVVEDRLVFIKRYSSALYCVDATNPSLPYLRSTLFSVHSVFGALAVSNRRLYVGDIARIANYYVDVSNPDSMVATRLYDLPACIAEMQVRDSLLFVCVCGSGLDIYSITIPDSPRLLSRTIIPAMTYVVSIALKGDTAYIAGHDNEIVAVGFSDPAHPQMLGTYQPRTNMEFTAPILAIGDTVLYCAYINGLTAVSIASIDSMCDLSSFPTGDETRKVIVRDGRGYVTSGMAGFYVVDVSDPANPRVRGNLRTAGYAYDLAVDSTVAYVSFAFPYCDLNHGLGRTGIWAIDISALDSLRVLDSCMMRFPCSMAKSGSLLFVTHGDVVSCEAPYDTALTILDVSNPSNIRIVGYVTGVYDIREITSRDSMCFLAVAGSGLKIYDCRDPGNPNLLSSVLPNALGVSVYEQRAYVYGSATGFPFASDSIFVFDISNLSAPVLLGHTAHPSLDFDWGCESVVLGDRAFWVGAQTFGVYDISNRSQPRSLFVDSDAPWGGGIDLVGDTLFVTDRYSGLWIFHYKGGITSVSGDMTVPVGTICLLPNYPNPFNATTQLAFSVGAREHVRLEVYNILGQHVATLFNGNAEAGEHRIEFNGGNLSSGIYLYRLFSDNATLSGKMLLLK